MSGGTLPEAATFLLAREVCPRCLGWRKERGPHSCSDALPTKGRGGDRRDATAPAADARMAAAERLARLVLGAECGPGSAKAHLFAEDWDAMRAEAKRVLGEMA